MSIILGFAGLWWLWLILALVCFSGAAINWVINALGLAGNVLQGAKIAASTLQKGEEGEPTLKEQLREKIPGSKAEATQAGKTVAKEAAKFALGKLWERIRRWILVVAFGAMAPFFGVLFILSAVINIVNHFFG